MWYQIRKQYYAVPPDVRLPHQLLLRVTVKFELVIKGPWPEGINCKKFFFFNFDIFFYFALIMCSIITSVQFFSLFMLLDFFMKPFHLLWYLVVFDSYVLFDTHHVWYFVLKTGKVWSRFQTSSTINILHCYKTYCINTIFRFIRNSTKYYYCK